MKKKILVALFFLVCSVAFSSSMSVLYFTAGPSSDNHISYSHTDINGSSTDTLYLFSKGWQLMISPEDVSAEIMCSEGQIFSNPCTIVFRSRSGSYECKAVPVNHEALNNMQEFTLSTKDAAEIIWLLEDAESLDVLITDENKGLSRLIDFNYDYATLTEFFSLARENTMDMNVLMNNDYIQVRAFEDGSSINALYDNPRNILSMPTIRFESEEDSALEITIIYGASELNDKVYCTPFMTFKFEDISAFDPDSDISLSYKLQDSKGNTVLSKSFNKPLEVISFNGMLPDSLSFKGQSDNMFSLTGFGDMLEITGTGGRCTFTFEGRSTTGTRLSKSFTMNIIDVFFYNIMRYYLVKMQNSIEGTGYSAFMLEG